MHTRRQLLKLSLVFSLTPPAIIVAGCTQSKEEPFPFQTGDVVVPPRGCTDLRQSNSQGDCG